MNTLIVALEHQREWLWTMAGVAAAALVWRWLRPAERRSLRMVWWLLLLGIVAHAVSTVSPGSNSTVAPLAGGAAMVLGGLAVIQMVTMVVFRGVLPALGLASPRIAQDLAVSVLSLAWGLVWLRLSGMDPSQLFTTSAVITAVLAFSMQDTLGNVLGGVTLQLDNSMQVGDWVEVDKVSGRVTDVRWRYTVVETRNRELTIVPNGWLMKNRFTVLRALGDAPLAWRRSIAFNVAPDADPGVVIEALERAVRDARITHVLQEPPPSAVLMEVSAGYYRYVLRYWLGDPKFDDATDSDVRIHALAALARADVRLGMPQEEVLMIKENDTWRAAQEQREKNRRIDAIRRTELFSHLSAAEQEALAAHLVHAPFAEGDTLTRQGAVAHWLYLIIHGEAQVLVDSPQGPVQIAMLRDGSVFGEMGMLTGEARSATVVAMTAVECYRLDKAGFAEILQARPELAQEMSAIVEARDAERTALLAQSGRSEQLRQDLVSRILRFFSLPT